MTRQIALALMACSLMRSAAVHAQAPADSTHSVGWRPIAIAVGAIAVGFTIDAQVARDVEGRQSAGTLVTARQFDRMGDVTGIAPIVGGVAVAGLLLHRQALVRDALLAIGSVAVSGAVTQVTKYGFGRVRPDADPDRDGFDVRFFSGSPAFPSGHTAAAFALATSLGDAIDRPLPRIALYLLASGTGWARVTEEEHWVSDVLAGAAVGIVSAKWMSGRVHLFGMRAPAIMLGASGAGVRWSMNLPGH